jgi:hypothetical protein
MLSFGLSLGILAFLTLVGYAVVTALRKQRNVLQDLLVAPVAGLSAVLIPVATLNRLGLPVGAFAAEAGLGLLALAALLLHRTRPIVPMRRYAPFAGAMLFAMLLSGWPMFIHGFEWVSYVNGDMITLSSAAQYMVDNGLFDGPNPADIAAGRDFSQYSWYLYAMGMHRLGAEMLLAWVSGLTGSRPDQVYMSVTIALHAGLVSTTAGLVLQSRRMRAAALLTAILLAMSALSAQAAVNQLCAQIGGLSFLAVGSALLMRPYGPMGWRTLARHSALLGVIMAGMLLYYPEMTPFLGLAFAIYLAVGRVRKTAPAGPNLAIAAGAALFCIALANTQIVAAVMHTTSAMGSSSTGEQVSSIFPFFLKPIGLPIFWGFSTFSFFWPEPVTSITIVAGGLLLLVVVPLVAWQAWRGLPAGILSLIMLVLAARFFATQSDFGLFKLAFFLQPFLIATIVVGWFALVRSAALRVAPLMLLSLAGCTGQTYYVYRSADFARAPFGIWRPSMLRVKGEFEALLERHPRGTLVVDSPNVRLVRLQTLLSRGRSFVPMSHMERLIANSPDRRPNAATLFALQDALHPGIVDQLHAINVLEGRLDRQRIIKGLFDMKKPGGAANGFGARRLPADEEARFVALTPQQGLFNRRQYRRAMPANYVAIPVKDLTNHLSFVHSDLGQYFFRSLEKMSFWQLEQDYFFPDASYAAAGAVLLFHAINPSASPRLAIEMTATLNGDQEHRLPPAAAIGDRRVSFPVVGRGSARVFSPAIEPQWFNGVAVVGIDMNARPKPYAASPRGLQDLYGAEIRLDRRRMVGFVRDISLVSQAEYTALEGPAKVETFPRDLANPSLEYSGVYEDGWLSEASYFMLSPGPDGRRLRLEATVPRFADKAFATDLVVLVDGQPTVRERLGIGRFKLSIEVPPSVAVRRRIELRFSRHQRVPGTSERVVGAKLHFLGVDEAAGSTRANTRMKE